MPELTPSERLEGHHLRALARFEGARVLDIGAGDGRLTAHFGALARHTALIDPDAEELALAPAALSAAGVTRYALHCGNAERLPYPAQSFDLAVFSWSL